MKLKLNGSYINFFVYNILWALLDIVTFGLAVPLHIYDMARYLVDHIEVITNEKK